MSDVIKLLPDSVANQIAAGEVIQRPASVVKELVENAVDAGATDIKIVLTDAGRTLIQVIDNGCGMSETDARLAFERHSTSKIRQASDLFSLHTMGFRGEALASIAAIAQVELRTQREGDAMGTQILISGSQCQSQQPAYIGHGSNFMVKNLFFNVPARRKFLKSNQVELSNIVKEFERLALVNHSLSFTLIHNDITMYQLRGGTFKSRIVELMGKSFDSQLLPINLTTTLVKLEGFVGTPEAARKRNQQQFLFVNGRYMRHPYFHKAIMMAYEQLIPADQQPNYFISFTVEPESIDVNIHPTKTEIKFENEKDIWLILNAAVKEAIGKASVAPTIDFDTVDAPDIPVIGHAAPGQAPAPAIDKDYNPFGNRPPRRTVSQDWEQLYNSFIDRTAKADTQSSVTPDAEPSQPVNRLDELAKEGSDTPCLQLKGKYLLSQVKSGLMIIDQHRAHTRILFDKFMALHANGEFESQGMLFPETLQLSATQHLALEEVKSELEAVGFDLAFLGNNTWAINGQPSAVKGVDIKELLIDVIDSVATGGPAVADRIFEHIALEVARRAAIPYGRILTATEMDTLQRELLQLPKPNFTPDGRKVIYIYSIDQIDRLF